MKIFKVLLIAILGGIIGAVCTLWYVNNQRMLDEYTYALKTNQSLFFANGNEDVQVNRELNNLLYIHLNRYLVARSYTPSFFTEETDSLMCSAFLIKDDDKDAYASLITKEGLTEYIDTKLRFCESG